MGSREGDGESRTLRRLRRVMGKRLEHEEGGHGKYNKKEGEVREGDRRRMMRVRMK